MLVFIHGWSCDSRYWRAQIPYFSQKYRIALVDLAGHGHSGFGRSNYTMGSFGEDVQAVGGSLGSGKGYSHRSFHGGVLLSLRPPDSCRRRCWGSSGVDTLEDVEYPFSAEQKEGMLAPFGEDFPGACREFVKTMLYPETDAVLQEWILNDMAAAPPEVAMSAMEKHV